MTITNIKQLIDIVLDSSRNGYFPELVINGETYDIWIKGLVYFPESRQPKNIIKEHGREEGAKHENLYDMG